MNQDWTKLMVIVGELVVLLVATVAIAKIAFRPYRPHFRPRSLLVLAALTAAVIFGAIFREWFDPIKSLF